MKPPEVTQRPVEAKPRLVWMAAHDDRTAHLFPARAGTGKALCAAQVLWRVKPLTIEQRCADCIEARRLQGG